MVEKKLKKIELKEMQIVDDEKPDTSGIQNINDRTKPLKQKRTNS